MSTQNTNAMSTPYHTVLWNASTAQPKDGERVLALVQYPNMSQQKIWHILTFYDANGGRWFLDGMIEATAPIVEWMSLPEVQE